MAFFLPHVFVHHDFRSAPALLRSPLEAKSFSAHPFLRGPALLLLLFWCLRIISIVSHFMNHIQTAH